MSFNGIKLYLIPIEVGGLYMHSLISGIQTLVEVLVLSLGKEINNTSPGQDVSFWQRLFCIFCLLDWLGKLISV